MRPARARPKKPPQQVSVRGELYERIREYAIGRGEQVGTVIDAILRRYLDEQRRES